MTDEIDIRMTWLPCGVCDVTFSAPGTLSPAGVHLAAFAHGWGIAEREDGSGVTACETCKTFDPSDAYLAFLGNEVDDD